MRLVSILVTLCIAASLVSISGCRQNNGQTQIQLRTDSLRGIRETKQKAFLVGKNLPVIDSILPVAHGRGRVVLIASGFDCRTCMEAGVKIIKDICSANKLVNDYMIEIESPMAINYLVYDKEIHKDIYDRLHASIGYLPTPLILVLNGNTISDVYLPVEEQLPSVGKFVQLHSK